VSVPLEQERGLSHPEAFTHDRHAGYSNSLSSPRRRC